MAESNREEIAKLEAIYANNPGGRVFTHLAEAYRKAGEHSHARSILETGIGRHPDYASAYVVLGRVLMDQGALQEAAGSFQRVLELDPENRVALRTMGDLARAEHPTEALVHYRQLQSLDPSDEELAQLIEQLEEQVGNAGPGDQGSVEPDAAAEPVQAGGAISSPEYAAAEPPSPVQQVGADFSFDWSAAESPLGADLPGDIEQLARGADEPWHVGSIDEPAGTVPAAFEAPAAPPESEPEFSELPLEPFAAADAADLSEPDAADPADLQGSAEPLQEPEAEAESTFEGLLSTDLGPESPLVAAQEDQPTDLPTETLAELYRTQGVYQRSIEVYQSLLEQRPDDERLRQKLEEVEQLERAAMVEPISGLSLDLDPGLDVDEALSVAEQDDRVPVTSEVAESVQSAWTDGGGAPDVTLPPYAWELEHDEDVDGPSLHQYLTDVLNWRPTVIKSPSESEQVAPGWDQQQPEPQADLASWVAPESELVVEHEVPAWEEPAEVQPWEPAPESELEFEQSEPAEPWLQSAAESFDEEAEPWLPPLSETVSAEAEPWLPADPIEAAADDLWLPADPIEAAADEPWLPADSIEPAADEPWLSLPEAVAEQPAAEAESLAPSGTGESKGSGVQDAFEEWFTDVPEAAEPSNVTATHEPKNTEAEPADADVEGDEESDDDLEMFRSWLQSLKR